MAARPVRRVVSLVPSLTEAIAATEPGLLIGATDWCSHPPDLAATRIGGTKNPDVARIADLAPDLVVANEEENREPDLAALRAAGLTVLVTEIRTLDEAFAELHRMLTEGCGLPRPAWLDDARDAWARARPVADLSVTVPIWRKPWMALGRDTFAGDLLARLGAVNALAGADERYPKVSIDDLAGSGVDAVLLPDEPYAFTPEDSRWFGGTPCAALSGRHLTWYGPSLTEAPEVLAASLRTLPGATAP